MMTKETATAKKGGIRIAIDWIDGDSDIEDASRRSFSPYRGVPPPSASTKGDELARSSHVRCGTRIHVDVCLTNPPSSALKVKADVFVDVRSSPNHGGDVCFASLPPATAKATKGRPDAGTVGDGESSGRWNDELRRDIAGMSNGELRREIAGLKAEARKRKGNANSRSSADCGGDVCCASPPPAVAKRKGRRDAAAEADGLYSGMSNDALRRDIAEMSDGELRREIAGLRNNNTHLQFQPRLAERRRRLLPLLKAEARRRQGSTRSRTQDVCNRGARTSTAKRVPSLHI